MANALYDTGRDAFANGNIDWVNDTIRAFLLDSADYTPNLATDDFLADVPTAARIGGTAGGTAYTDGIALTGKSTSAGVCDATDITFPTVTGDQAEYILIYKQGATGDSDSQLIALIDTATGIPVTPGGGNIPVTWDDGANKIFKL